MHTHKACHFVSSIGGGQETEYQKQCKVTGVRRYMHVSDY